MLRILMIFAFLSSSVAMGSSRQFGLGAIVGAPTGISASYQLTDSNRIAGALGWSLGDDVNYHIHGDFLLLRPGAVVIDEIPLDVYFGIGARIKDRDTNDKDDDFRLGARAPVGIYYHFEDPSIEVFGEFAFIMDVIESTALDFNLGLGARFWF